MKRIAASEARERLAELLNEVSFRGERVLLHRHGKDVAALVSVADLELMEALEDRFDLELARDALKEATRWIEWDQVKRTLLEREAGAAESHASGATAGDVKRRVGRPAAGATKRSAASPPVARAARTREPAKRSRKKRD